jgi:hypothetical protein
VVDYALAADPKIKFYATREQRDAALIHGELLTEDDIFALLAAGPDQTKEPLLSVELGEHDWESAELRYLLSQHKVIRAEQPNEDHSAMLIWKKGFKPVPA